MTEPTLAPEWQRVDLLATLAFAARRGRSAAPEERQRLASLQREVATLRTLEPWRGLVEQFGLLPLDQEILSCALAPEADPQIGWMFQELQPGVGSPFPTPALVDELAGVGGQAGAALRERLVSSRPLLGGKLLEQQRRGSYYPLVPTELAQGRLLARAPAALVVPGAVELETRATLADLVLPQRCLDSLRQFLYFVAERDKVVRAWGARAYGGPVALLAGPSGTGKTFAAEAIANALGFKLFRVDLGLLVSKYVGETEKNLNALFDACHGQDLVLLFDEADSLFGKRGEVREARDRYANMEVSHLLSRIERHVGPCVLTTNLRHHLDPAFARRFHVVVDFPMPDPTQRRELWQRSLPPRAPLARELDLDAAAREVQLTGAQIRNAATHAACLAAAESMPITSSHLARAIYAELEKDGTEVFASSLGALARHVPFGATP